MLFIGTILTIWVFDPCGFLYRVAAGLCGHSPTDSGRFWISHPVCIIIYAQRHGYNHVINDSLKTARMQITQTRKFILGIKSHSTSLFVCACISKYCSR